MNQNLSEGIETSKMENVGGKKKFFALPFFANYLTLCLMEERQRGSTFILFFIFLLYVSRCNPLWNTCFTYFPLSLALPLLYSLQFLKYP